MEGTKMADFVEVPIPGGGSLLVEVTESVDEVVRAGRLHDLADSATESFESALDRVARAAEAARHRLKKLEPSETTVEFAIKLASEAGVVVASTSLEANLKIQMRWTKE
jgi:Trypsin-co-occurring domain 1